MATRKIINNDASFGNGANDLVTGGEEVQQQVKFLLESTLGSWKFDLSYGFDYDSLKDGTIEPQTFESIISERLQTIEGVSRIINVTVSESLNEKLEKVFVVDVSYVTDYSEQIINLTQEK